VSVRFGIVGAGAMARAYAQAITTEVADGELVAVAGGRRAPDVARDYGVDLDATPAELFARADVDAVIVATPPSSHMEHSVAAARAGKHVLVEKPMGRSLAECDAMVGAAREAGVVLAVNKLTRYRDTGLEAGRAVARGDVGEVRMIRVELGYVGLEEHTPATTLGDASWLEDPAEGSAFLDWGSHACDMIRWLSGSEATVAFARFEDYREAPRPPLGRSGMAQYTLESGAVAQVLMSSELPPPGLHETLYVVVGSEGILEIDMYATLRLGRADGWQVLAEQAPIDYMNDPWNPERVRGWARQVQELAECILHGGRPGVTGEDGRAAIEMVLAAERSSESGEAVHLPLARSRA
jgi:predicted dehydrogenase